MTNTVTILRPDGTTVELPGEVDMAAHDRGGGSRFGLHWAEGDDGRVMCAWLGGTCPGEAVYVMPHLVLGGVTVCERHKRFVESARRQRVV